MRKLEASNKVINSFFDNFVKEITIRRYWLAYLVFISMVAFAYELFNFSLTIDEELYAGMTSAASAVGWIQQGRWGMYILGFIFPINPIIPFVPMFVALLFSAFAFAVVTNVMSAKHGLESYIAAPLFVACPVLYYSYSFNTLSYGLGIGFFIGAVAIYLFVHSNDWKKWVLSPFLMAVTISIYQALLIWLVALYCLKQLNDLIGEDKTTLRSFLRRISVFVLVLILAFFCYFVISKMFYFIFHLQPSAYLSGFSRWELSWSYLLQVVHSMWKGMLVYYTGSATLYYEPVYLLSTLFVLSCCVIFIAIVRVNQSITIKLCALVLLVFIVTVPFSMYFLLGSAMPARTMLAIPLVLSMVVLFAMRHSFVALKVLLAVLTVSCAFQFISINNRFAFSDHMMWQSDREFTSRLLDEMRKEEGNLPVKLASQQWPFMLVGTHAWPEYPTMVQRETIGASFYSWGGGNLGRALTFMRSMGISSYRAATIEEQKQIMSQAHQMPVWPNKGAVATVHGVLVVKIGNYTAPQLQAACDNIISSPVCRIQYHPLDDGIRMANQKPEQLLYDYLQHQGEMKFQSLQYREIIENTLELKVLSSNGMLSLPIITQSKEKILRLNISIHEPKNTSMRLFFLFRKTNEIGGQIHLSLNAGDNHFSLNVPSYLLERELRIVPSTQIGAVKFTELSISEDLL